MYSVGSFFSTVSKFYSEINPATLSGAIDIVVVQQANGDLACSPFHVRFGKLSVLRPQEKVVEVRVNGNVIAFPMKVGDAGEAFFVLETDDYVPDEFATSPIAGPTDESDLTPVDYFDLNGHPHSNDKQKQKQIEGAVNGQYPVGEEGMVDTRHMCFMMTWLLPIMLTRCTDTKIQRVVAVELDGLIGVYSWFFAQLFVCPLEGFLCDGKSGRAWVVPVSLASVCVL